MPSAGDSSGGDDDDNNNNHSASTVPRSTIALAVGITAPFLLILMGAIMIWGYVIGRRDRSGTRQFRFQKRRTPGRPPRRRVAEVDGGAVHEMAAAGGGRVAEMDGRAPAELVAERRLEPAEMCAEREPVELAAAVGTPAAAGWLLMGSDAKRF
ncbi:hypothetical protein B0J12DRAFT_662140 [Macrophomina phaseolina]|uniref:Uncharacterized protein n=1 Tax=Macrophomina phaseolina TaxID=35725 RepID=A0ABQ8GBP5_9PEZI|nr:hypothetical protein B0J12DRAFT_662140 [Macrophomina phaseolina]